MVPQHSILVRIFLAVIFLGHPVIVVLTSIFSGCGCCCVEIDVDIFCSDFDVDGDIGDIVDVVVHVVD